MKYIFAFFVLGLLLTNNSLRSQVVIDWSKQHTSPNIDFIGWNNEFLSATITGNNQFKVRSGGYEDVIINYVNWDGSRWTARLNGDNFLHAPDGNWSAAHPDARMDYIAPDNTKWSATISGNGFILKDQNGVSHQSDFLHYITWDGTAFTAELNKPNFIHSAGAVYNHHVQIRSSIKYQTWDHSKWTATINADGSFVHTNENGVSHSDRNIIYLNYDQSMWGARLYNNGFVHASAFIPKEKTFGDKFLEVVHGMGLGNGFPGQIVTTPNADECVVTVNNKWGTLEIYGVRFKVGQPIRCEDLVDLGPFAKGTTWVDKPLPRGWNVWLVFKTSRSGGCGSSDTKYEINGIGNFAKTKVYDIN